MHRSVLTLISVVIEFTDRLINSLSLSVLTAIFPGEPGFVEWEVKLYYTIP